jgi:hypothetical protein
VVFRCYFLCLDLPSTSYIFDRAYSMCNTPMKFRLKTSRNASGSHLVLRGFLYAAKSDSVRQHKTRRNRYHLRAQMVPSSVKFTMG